ncbi:ABC-F family ATP-binding cassette domain-containing protein [Deinococcus oregonensis]|uniref:ABC-F family ATP-binding cassette domain-containing protein n=1 Tax=Deinococcus oregonensis TaxID=1805970 RepID=A0ABV6BAJ8_9DEIO
MLHIENVSRVLGDRVLFAGVDLDVHSGQRLALIGENGSGKTTLLRVLAGLDQPDVGRVMVTRRVALLEQERVFESGTVLEVVTPAALRQARLALELTSARLENGASDAITAFAEAEEAYRLAGGYHFEARAGRVLAGLGLHPESKVTQLSGGQNRRVLLARLLLAPADLFLLDEPTNHLDEQGAVWLRDWIRASDAAFVLASHDRAFLDAVTTSTAELDRGHLTVYPAPYTQAMVLKAELLAAQTRDYAAFRRKQDALEDERLRRASQARSAGQYNHKRASDGDKLLAKGKAQNAQNVNASRARAIERRQEHLAAHAPVKPFANRPQIHLNLPEVPHGPSEILHAQHLSVWRGERQLLKDQTLDVRRGDRIVLTGPNGGGKTTLLTALFGLPTQQPLHLQGEIRRGGGLSVYRVGQQGEELAGLETVAEALLEANPALTFHQLHEVTAQVNLPGPAIPLTALSGGQRTRLTLARLGVTRAQVWVLDEPTNHLDLPAIEALEALLMTFPGTVVMATHDQALIARVATRRWHVEAGQVWEGVGGREGGVTLETVLKA